MNTRLGYSFVLFGVKIAKDIDRTLEVKLMNAFGYDWKAKDLELDTVDDEEYYGEDEDGSSISDEVFEDFLLNHLEPKKHLVVISDTDDGAPKDSVYLGRMLRTDERYGLEKASFSIAEITKIVDDINRKLKTKHKAEVLVGTCC